MGVFRVVFAAAALLLAWITSTCSAIADSQPSWSGEAWKLSPSLEVADKDPLTTSTARSHPVDEQVDLSPEANNTTYISDEENSLHSSHPASEEQRVEESPTETTTPLDDVTVAAPAAPDAAQFSSVSIESSPVTRDAMHFASEASLDQSQPSETSAFDRMTPSTGGPFAQEPLTQLPPEEPNLPTAAQSEPETSLFYQTADGQVFGPFAESQVLEWCYEGYFTAELPVTTDPRQFPFLPLGEWLNRRPYSPSLHDPHHQHHQQPQQQPQQSQQSHTPQYTPQYAPQYTPQYAPQYTPQYAPQYTPQYSPQYPEQVQQHWQPQWQPQQQQYLQQSRSWNQPTASLSTWLTRKVSKGLDQLQQHTPVVDTAQLSQLWQASSQNVKKAMSWQTMKRTASKLGLTQLKTVLPKRSRYQDATLDAMWSKKNRQLKTWSESLLAKMPALPVATPEHGESDDRTAADGESTRLFSFAAAEREGDAPSMGGDEDNDAVVTVPRDDAQATVELDAAATSSRVDVAPLAPSGLANDMGGFDPSAFSTATVAPSPSSSYVPPLPTGGRRRRSSLLSALRALPASIGAVFTVSGRRSAGGRSDDVLQLWDESERQQQQQRHTSDVVAPLAGASHTRRSTTAVSHSAVRGLSVVIGTAALMLQGIAWVVLLQQVVTDVDWAVWMPRVEDVLQRIVVVDFFDVALYRHVGHVALQRVLHLLQQLASTTPLALYDAGRLWVEHVRSWLVHTDNAATATVLASSLLLGGLARGAWLPTTLVAATQALWMAVFALCVCLLRTKVLASLEITAGAAAVSVATTTTGAGAGLALTPGTVLVLRVASVVQRLQLLWVASLCFLWLRRGARTSNGVAGHRHRDREDAAASAATVDAWRRLHPHYF